MIDVSKYPRNYVDLDRQWLDLCERYKNCVKCPLAKSTHNCSIFYKNSYTFETHNQWVHYLNELINSGEYQNLINGAEKNANIK